MGWSTGSEIAQELWDKIKKDIKTEKLTKVKKSIIKIFEAFDCDTMEEVGMVKAIKFKGAKLHDLRVWHIPQVPMPAFYVKVKNIEEAKLVLNVLADYDAFQFENKVKPDYSNAQGLEVFDGKEWCDWYDEDDQDILEVMREIHKLKCDVCGNEKDLLEEIYDRAALWHEWEERGAGSFHVEKKHFCSDQCCIDYLNKKKGADR